MRIGGESLELSLPGIYYRELAFRLRNIIAHLANFIFDEIPNRQNASKVAFHIKHWQVTNVVTPHQETRVIGVLA